MQNNAQGAGKYFNGGEEHERAYAAGKYENPEVVAAFIKEESDSGHFHYWTHEKLHAYLEKKGFKKKS
ncbi:hypothetical protein KL86DPRO_20650 [uncultured delta proteobacterium]|uniref:Uncharacterized protein n=1 Tax=uncultured delta proteobacterium TaxID=34034 RepID=A0A212K3S6_9DELT|nr:hypothetical protein KL86DPRO_20650 [uncultured delta proteobacterium]